MIDAELLERLIAYLRAEVPRPLPAALDAGTDLRKDLRMAEEDAEDLLAKLFSDFGIDPGDFDFTRYFPSEGLWPFGRSKPGPVPLTVGMLAKASVAGVWRTAEVEG